MRRLSLWSCFLLVGCLDVLKSSEEAASDNEDTPGYYLEGEQYGDCFDGMDNDQDGEMDCEDPGCFDKPACSEDTGVDDTGSDTGEETGEDTDVTEELVCGENAPVIVSISCENTGIQYHPDMGEMPTFTIRSSVEDENGDLRYYRMLIQFDSVIDGTWNGSELEVSGAISGEDCETFTADVGATIYLQGNNPDYEIPYEWFISVADEQGNFSDPVMIVCVTPNEDGEGEPN